ncbi:MAG: hypothetical protein JO224_04815 [Pelomonas sp.]|nr:hypothetical protein [Roseateles sp.]
MQRRRLLATLAAGAAATALAGCGFALRREPELRFKTLALAGFGAKSPLAVELKRQIGRAGIEIVEDPNRAEVVLEAERDQQDKIVVVSTSAGQVREWQLNLYLDYVVRRPDSELLLPRQALAIAREMTYTESQALAKEQEEAQLYRAMRSDAVNQVLRRLANVRVN